MGKKRARTYSTPFQVEQIAGGLVNGEVKSKPKRVPIVPKWLPKLHCLCGAFGVVRSGKSNALVNLIDEYWKHKSLNMLFCISPTYDSNTSLQTLPFEENGIFTDSTTSVQALDRICSLIEQRVMEHNEEEEYRTAYKAWRKGRETPNEYARLSRQHFRKPQLIPWPQPGIFIDDMTHTELMANTINNKLSHLSLHHRHLHNVGVSIFQAFQTFRSGMPKVVRGNLGLILLFPTCNMQEIEDIYKEVSNNITFETFKRLLFEATKGTHDFLLIDKLCEDPCKQFGRNFDQKFIIDPVEERRKLLSLNSGPEEPSPQGEEQEENPNEEFPGKIDQARKHDASSRKRRRSA